MSDENENVVQVYHSPITAKFEYQDLGSAMNHNYLCAVCRNEKAVIDMNIGILQPCWKCQNKYKLIKLNFIDKLLGR